MIIRFIKRRLGSFGFAFAGLRDLLLSQPNARIHAVATVVVVAAAVILRAPLWAWCWLIACAAAVWSAEAMNTAFELLCNHVTPEQNATIGRIKDLAAGAVLIVAAAAALVGGLLLVSLAD